jgi:hypothetical protein
MRLAKAFPEVLQGSSNKYQNWELVDPEKWVPDGWLRASQRKVDAARSLPYRPFHSHDEEWPLNPGEPIELDVEIWPTCIVVPAGYRLGLTVRGRDYEVTRRALRWRTPRPQPVRRQRACIGARMVKGKVLVGNSGTRLPKKGLVSAGLKKRILQT